MARSRRGHILFKYRRSHEVDRPTQADVNAMRSIDESRVPEVTFIDYESGDDYADLAVCPEHLRFVPCRKCPPGQEQFSIDPEDIERAREFHRRA